jgi:hypothetical protein
MKQIFFWFFLAAMSLSISCAQQPASKPPALTNTNTPSLINTNFFGSSTNGIPLNATTEDLERMVLKPPTSKAPISTTPTYFDTEPAPPLNAEALHHQYLGFRLGMSADEANLVAQTASKKLESVEEGKRYQMKGCLTSVPEAERARTLLLFKDAKLNLIMLFWDDNNTLFIDLERLLKKKYGKPAKVDELFRRYWFLENGDCIRLLFDVAARQTGLTYGDKQSVFEQSEREKREIMQDFLGL